MIQNADPEKEVYALLENLEISATCAHCSRLLRIPTDLGRVFRLMSAPYSGDLGMVFRLSRHPIPVDLGMVFRRC